MDTVETASRKVKQMGRQIESSMGNLKNMMSSISLVGDAKHFQEGKGKFDALREKLENKSEKQKLDAMKTLIAMMTLGRDVSELFPAVVKNVVVESMEIKKLVYMYVIHYASTNPNLALLSISSFQKDMSSPNPLVRAKALHAMSCMRVTSVTHLIILALKNAVKDSSPYVRRTASQVLPSVCKLDSKWKVDLIAMLTVLLSDDNVYVLSGALYAFNMLCPNKFDLIHINYRKICHLLADMDEYGQVIALKILLRYCRNQFKSPFIKEEEEKQFDETKEEEEEEESESDSDNLLGLGIGDEEYIELNSDHKLLIDSCKNLMYSMNSAVVLAVVTLLFYCAPKNDCIDGIRALIQFINFSRREISYNILANISTMASIRPYLFAGFYKDFYIKSIEARFIKELKLDILSKTVNDGNIGHILREFEAYAKDSDIKFRCSTIEAMGRCASMIPDVAEKTMHSLMSLLQPSNQSPDVVASSVIVIRQIIQRNPSNYTKSMLKLLNLLQKTNVPQARCAIVWIIGEYRQYISDYVPDALRILAKKFIHEANEVKMQILNLAVKVYLADPKKVILLFKYILDLCKYDQNYDLRDRARLVRCIFFQKKKKKSNTPKNNINDIDPEIQRELRTKMQEMFLSEKKLPEIVSPFQDRDRFTMNTLSHMVLHSAGENYQPLMDFPDIPPDNNDKRTPMDSSNDNKWKSASPKEKNNKDGKGFFDGSSVEEYTSGSSSGDTDDSDDSDSDSDESSDDSGDSDSNDSDSDSESESDSGSESDEDSNESDSVSFSDSNESVKQVNINKKEKKKQASSEDEGEEEEQQESDEESDSSSSSSSVEVIELLVTATNSSGKLKDNKSKDKKNKKKKEINEKELSENESENESEDELIDISDINETKKDKKKKKKKKQKKEKPKEDDLLGDLFGDMAAKSKVPTTDTTTTTAISTTNTNTNQTFDMFDLLGGGGGDTNSKKIESNPSDNITKPLEKKKSKKSKKSKKKKQTKELSTDSSSESEDELGSDDFASSDSEEEKETAMKSKKEKEFKESEFDNIKRKERERGDQLSDLFSSVMGTEITNNKTITNVSDDILFGASAETLMKSEKDFVGFKGELLNHTHTQGLQIDYEFVRQPSRYGIRFNQIKLIFENKWDKNMCGISLCPHNLDKSQQDYRDIFDGGIDILKPLQKKIDFIHVQFGKTSEMRFSINVEKGTNKKRHTAKIKGIPGELMRPNISYSVDDFIKKKGQTGAMNERNLNCEIENIEEAANSILKVFNVGIVNSGAMQSKFDMSKQRYFAAYLLADDSDVLIALDTQINGKIICTIHCTEFMLIDAITGVARQCLSNK